MKIVFSYCYSVCFFSDCRMYILWLQAQTSFLCRGCLFLCYKINAKLIQQQEFKAAWLYQCPPTGSISPTCVCTCKCVCVTMTFWTQAPFTSMPVMLYRLKNVIVLQPKIRGSRGYTALDVRWGVISFFFIFWREQACDLCLWGTALIFHDCAMYLLTLNMRWIKHDWLHNQELLLREEG